MESPRNGTVASRPKSAAASLAGARHKGNISNPHPTLPHPTPPLALDRQDRMIFFQLTQSDPYNQVGRLRIDRLTTIMKMVPNEEGPFLVSI